MKIKRKHSLSIDLTHKFGKNKYEYKINKLRQMIEKKVGFPVLLERSPTGELKITPELYRKVPDVLQ